jgi:hypothetical protein
LQQTGRHRDKKSDWQPLTDWSKFRAFILPNPNAA